MMRAAAAEFGDGGRLRAKRGQLQSTRLAATVAAAAVSTRLTSSSVGMLRDKSL